MLAERYQPGPPQHDLPSLFLFGRDLAFAAAFRTTLPTEPTVHMGILSWLSAGRAGCPGSVVLQEESKEFVPRPGPGLRGVDAADCTSIGEGKDADGLKLQHPCVIWHWLCVLERPWLRAWLLCSLESCRSSQSSPEHMVISFTGLLRLFFCHFAAPGHFVSLARRVPRCARMCHALKPRIQERFARSEDLTGGRTTVHRASR